MFLAPVLLVLASGASEAKAAPPKTEPTAEPTTDADGDELANVRAEEAARRKMFEDYERDQVEAKVDELKKAGFPIPPSQERTGYLAWKKKLTAKTRKRVERFCRTKGVATYYPICDGIGPFAIPVPPSQVAMPKRDAGGNLIGMTHDQWRLSLTTVQRREYERLCVNTEEPGTYSYSELCGGTPIVLAFGGQRVAYRAAGEHDGTDWPTAETPWLARDVDGDGQITSSAELFGSDTELANGSLAADGFAALAPLDVNHDGRIDDQDPGFASLLIWTDADGNRRSSPEELRKLGEVVIAIQLGTSFTRQCDARGNCEGERSAVWWHDDDGVHEGAAIDVFLHYR